MLQLSYVKLGAEVLVKSPAHGYFIEELGSTCFSGCAGLHAVIYADKECPPHTAAAALQLALLAQRGITGPLKVFEGQKGFMDTIAGPFQVDWLQEDLERVQRTLLKKYDAEIHSQTALELLLQLKAAHRFDPAAVARIEVEIFDVAYKIIGGGEEGDKTVVRTKEEADHSLPYLLAVALLDGQITPQQYQPERIRQSDVQSLLRRVFIHPNEGYSERFPNEMPASIRVIWGTAQIVEGEISVPEAPSWDRARQKFEYLAGAYTSAAQRAEIVDMVSNLEDVRISDLMNVLAAVAPEMRAA